MAHGDPGTSLDEAQVDLPTPDLDVSERGPARDELLRRALEPLAQAGWLLYGPWSEESWEFGDSVGFDLHRGDRHLQAELYEDGDLALWMVHPDGDGDVYDDPDVEWNHGPEDLDRLRSWYEDLSLLP